jgi:hypothetical protein
MGSGEAVKGAEDYVWNYEMYVPPGGFFVDDEMWLMWVKKPGWVETGEEAEPGGCGCTLYPFFAQNTESNKYYEYVSPASVAGPTNNGYRILSNSNGTWSIYWEPSNPSSYKLIATVSGGYSSTATELQAGMEAASASQPDNEESTVVKSEWLEGNWHWWEGTHTKAREISEAGTCIHSSPAGGPGSTYNGTTCGRD